jgi:hypothetical protein
MPRVEYKMNSSKCVVILWTEHIFMTYSKVLRVYNHDIIKSQNSKLIQYVKINSAFNLWFLDFCQKKTCGFLILQSPMSPWCCPRKIVSSVI